MLRKIIQKIDILQIGCKEHVVQIEKSRNSNMYTMNKIYPLFMHKLIDIPSLIESKMEMKIMIYLIYCSMTAR